jgi:hypothetical protein
MEEEGGGERIRGGPGNETGVHTSEEHRPSNDGVLEGPREGWGEVFPGGFRNGLTHL